MEKPKFKRISKKFSSVVVYFRTVDFLECFMKIKLGI